jgi:glycosyltransferase involved in cell wall biosynthesis
MPPERAPASAGAARPYRLAALATHPIQYQAPLWRAIAGDPRFALKVFYTDRHGAEERLDPGFGVCFAWDVPLLDGYEHEFLCARRVPGLRGPRGLWPLGLTQRLGTGSFEALLVHGYATATAWAGLRAAFATKTPVILRGESHLRARRTAPRRILKEALLRPLLRRVAGVLAIGAWNREYWQALGVREARMRTALYTVDVEFFRARAVAEAERARALRAAWLRGEDGIVFLFAGKLIPVKGPDLLLEAFARLAGAGQGPLAVLVFAGDGVLREPLRQRAAALGLGPRVHFTGVLGQQDLPAHYAAADCLVLPSLFEPWGLVVNEALACGTPCIVSDAAGVAGDLVRPDVNGRVFSAGRVEGLGEAMAAVLDPATRSSWRRGAREPDDRATVAANREEMAQLLATIRARGVA